MARRTYDQACPMALALDLVGERWTLLIVRDLLLGPLRFSDLAERLPGIGKNLLSDRLQYLVQHELIVHTKLPPPAASAVYQLTEAGLALEPVLIALAGWTMRYRAGDIPQGSGAPDLVGIGLKMCFQPSDGVTAVHAFSNNGHSFYATIESNTIRVQRGHAPTKPEFEFDASPEIWMELLQTRTLNLDAAAGAGKLTYVGTPNSIAEGLKLYGMKVTVDE